MAEGQLGSPKKRWLVSRKTVIAALHNDEDLCGVVVFNELTNTVQARKPWPWPYSTPGEIKSADGLLLGNYLSEKYRLPALSKASLEEAIQTVSFVERFHPIREWLEGLEWDGKPRLDKWLVHALGETNKSINAKLFDYMGLVGRYWVLGMVYRVMEPGCKFDYCPVLEGNSADVAAAGVGAGLWLTTTTYAVGNQAWSPMTGLIYRRLIAGRTAVDPSVDRVNWTEVRNLPVGAKPNQAPAVQDLGALAFMDVFAATQVSQHVRDSKPGDVWHEWVGNTQLIKRFHGLDGVVRSLTENYA